jgi:hypothetical protein
MSSLRPAKIVAMFVRFLGGSLFWPDVADGPTCSCESCRQAWRQNQSPDFLPPRARVRTGLRRVGPG